MNEIRLAYGRDSVGFSFDEARFQVLTGNSADEKPLSDLEIGNALDQPISSLPLDEIIAPSESVLIVVSDATRATASAQILNLLVRRLLQTGISPADVAIIFATGIHRPVNESEKVELLTPFIAQRVRTIDHNAFDASSLVQLGRTQRDTLVEVNRALQEFDHVVLTGAIGFHYFAGFTGGRKSICPGLASAGTIQATHMMALDFATGGRRDGVGTGLLDGNPVNDECERIAEMIKPGFSINSVVDERGRAVHIYAGDWRAAHRLGCKEYLSTHSVAIKEKRDVVVASCGGPSYDINLIQAHKALDMAAQACQEGGTIILLAECRDGFGRPDFLKWFSEKDSRSLANRLREGYEVNGQTAWALLTKAEHYRILLVSSLPDEDVRRMRMIPAKSFEAVVDSLSPNTQGYIMPRGAAVFPREESR